ncbi:hypothetical protein [Streptococcus anginosus]|uniref:hypothetical protein n=1 Tax=Streptococcus anginosus TaxID=1328 RepID=UPI0020017CF3|nr:hypothetical protein [Streptococcus anginosus]
MTEKIILSGRAEQELYKEFCNLACNDLEGAKSKIQQFSDDELRIYQEIILSVSESANDLETKQLPFLLALMTIINVIPNNVVKVILMFLVVGIWVKFLKTTIYSGTRIKIKRLLRFLKDL